MLAIPWTAHKIRTDFYLKIMEALCMGGQLRASEQKNADKLTNKKAMELLACWPHTVLPRSTLLVKMGQQQCGIVYAAA